MSALPHARFAPGEVLAARYRIERPIARGGMGEVYAAYDLELQGPIALKLLRPDIAPDPLSLRRFKREVLLARQVTHPNVCRIYDIGRHSSSRGTVVFLTMEMLAGETLAARLRAGGPMSEAETLRVLEGLARALDAAHEAGIAHLDFKPGNVMLVPTAAGERVVVTDFGLARAAATSSEASDEPGTEGHIQGTPAYVSPESVRGERAGPSSDLYALGIVLFEMLTGRVPHRGGTPRETALLRIQKPAPAPSSLVPGLRPIWDRQIERLLDPDPLRRPASAAQVLRALGPAPADPTDEPPGNLALPATRFIGRLAERGRLVALLQESRLVTLVGPAGVGKSRLATETAAAERRHYPGGVWRIELAPIDDPSLLPRALALALGLRDAAGESSLEAVARTLQKRRALLLLDDCDRLPRAAQAFCSALLEVVPGLQVLATSREALGGGGEAVLRVEPLAIEESVALFGECARRALPSFAPDRARLEPIAELCRRLDGVPLAIELAAARLGTLPLEELLRRLDDRFHLLTGGQSAGPGEIGRHQTLAAAIDWTHDSLGEKERVVLRRIAAFADRFPLEAAEELAGFAPIEADEVLDLLTRLVDRSLLHHVKGGEAGLYHLLESLRAYGRERLEEAGEGDAIRFRLLETLTRLAESAVPRLAGPDRSLWLLRLDDAREDLRAASAFAATHPEGRLLGLRLGAALGRYHELRGTWSEGRRLLETALSSCPDDAPRAARARLLASLARLAFRLGDVDGSRGAAGIALVLARPEGDLSTAAQAAITLGNLAQREANLSLARAHYEEGLGLAREARDRTSMAEALSNLGGLARDGGDFDTARRLWAESLSMRRTLGERLGVAATLNNLALVSLDLGEPELARPLLEESLAIKRALDDRNGIADSLNNLAIVAAQRGDLSAARARAEESLVIRRDLGDPSGEALALHTLGEVALSLGDKESARSQLAASLTLFHALGNRLGIAFGLEGLGEVALLEGRPEQAAACLGRAEALRALLGIPRPPAEKPRLERVVAATRQALGEERFRSAWAAGREQDQPAAVRLALGEGPPS